MVAERLFNLGTSENQKNLAGRSESSGAVLGRAVAGRVQTETWCPDVRRAGLPAGLVVTAPCVHARSGCQTHDFASGSASAPSPLPRASPPSGSHSRTRWLSSLCPAAEHYKGWLPAPGFSNATQITYKTVACLNTESQRNATSAATAQARLKRKLAGYDTKLNSRKAIKQPPYSIDKARDFYARPTWDTGTVQTL